MRRIYTFINLFLLMSMCNGIWSKPKSPSTLLVDCPAPITLKEGSPYDTSVTGAPKVTSNNGGPVTISYLEVYQKGDCKNRADVVLRIFTIRNSSGEEVRCNQNITIKHLTSNEIYFPSDTTIDYPDSITTLVESFLPVISNFGSIKLTYFDTRISENCNQPVRIRRQWSLEDVCTGQIRSVTTFMSIHKYFNHFKHVNKQSEAVCVDEGFIELTPVGEFKPYKYKWNSGDSTAFIFNKFPGTYTLTITDRFGCSISKVYSLLSISQRADIGGKIATDVGIRVVPDSLIFENGALISVACVSQQSGIHYGFTLKSRTPGQYNYRFVKNSGVRDGLSTKDIVLIQRHILGITKFKDTLQNIAADVNYNFNITASDIVELRRILLGLKNEFTVVKPWYFLRKDWRSVAKPNKPIADIEFKGVTVGNFPLTNVDVFALKMGDVDVSFDGARNEDLTSRSNSDKVILEFRSAKRMDDENWIPVYLNAASEITGIQFSLLDKINRELKIRNSQIDDSYIHLRDNKITVSWSSGQVLKWNRDLPLFYINASRFEDLQEEEGYSSEWYDGELNVYTLKLKSSTDGQGMATGFFYPNPTADKIQFNFDFKKLEVKLYHADGRVILSNTLRNNEELKLQQIKPGLYILSVQLENGELKSDLLQLK